MIQFTDLLRKGLKILGLLFLACRLITPLPGFSADTARRRVAVASAAEFAAALGKKAAQTGDEIVLQDGIYDGVNADCYSSQIAITAEHPGKAIIKGAYQITIKGGQCVIDGLVFDGAKSAQRSGGIILEGDHCVVRNCTFVNMQEADGAWIGVKGTHNTIKHCTFGRKTDKYGYILMFRTVGRADCLTVEYNKFVERQNIHEFDNDAEILRLGSSKESQSESNSVIQHNLFYDCDGNQETEGLCIKAGGNTIQFNTFIKCQQTVSLRHGARNVVQGNVFIGGDENGGGIRIMDRDHVIQNNYLENLGAQFSGRGSLCLMSHEDNPKLNGYWPVQNVLVCGNTIVNCRQSIVLCGEDNPNPPEAVIFQKNIVADAKDKVAIKLANAGDARDRKTGSSGNIYWNSELGVAEDPAWTLKDPQFSTSDQGLKISSTGEGAKPTHVYSLDSPELGPQTYRFEK